MAAVTVGRTSLVETNLLIAQGADNPFTWRYSIRDGDVSTPVDLTGYSAEGQIRARIGGEIYLDLTGHITLQGESGVIQMMIPAAVTESEAWNSRRVGVWDMELTAPDGGKIRFTEGTVTIDPDATRHV
ncbi:hypothetical protein [Glaciibacter superstes]|uniref:hypothetical protein n=1 Tax=Glaciibacter superstes TaxID=501023 RepID=UPI0003B60EAF|nr:hypothetical protein [Glaciibacter superstes]